MGFKRSASFSVDVNLECGTNLLTKMPHAKTNKPRGRSSAYVFFVQKFREEQKKLNPKESVGFSEFSKKCSEKWKTMDEQDKHSFVDMANKDKERFDNETAYLIGSEEYVLPTFFP